MTSLRLAQADPSSLRADAIVVGIAKGAEGPVLLGGAEGVDAAFGGRLASLLDAVGATGAAEEVIRVPAAESMRAPVVVAAGVGVEAGSYEPERLRRAAGAATRALAGAKSVVLALPTGSVEELGAVAEGALLGAYVFTRYRTGEEVKAPVAELTVVSPLPEDDAVRAALTRAEVLGEAVNLARDLVNTPPSDLHPAALATATQKACSDDDVEVEVLDERALREGGYGGIIGVGQGSANPPRLVRIAWSHPEASKHITFVGKGITFDSGGLSIKPADGMITMKMDMGGAAAVIAAVRAVARLGLAVNVTAWAPMAENMPSATAQRPSDVLRIYGGKTVEVLNTDAEGRLVLADALVRAAEDDPDLIVDVATLTGACPVALGPQTTGIMANDDALRDQIHATATRAGESMWPLPLPDELRKSLDSSVADIANQGDRLGGALVAGLFLKEFVPDEIKWAHLDIAGPAYTKEPYGYTPKGGTGATVRTLVALAEDVAAARIP